MQLDFLQGFDTIVRFFDAKYYPPPGSLERSMRTFFDECNGTVICARRGTQGTRAPPPAAAVAAATASGELTKVTASGEQEREQGEEEEAFLAREDVKPYVTRGLVKLVNLSADGSLLAVSSTRVRELAACVLNNSDDDDDQVGGGGAERADEQQKKKTAAREELGKMVAPQVLDVMLQRKLYAPA